MKAYCETCTSLQPSSFRPGNDAVTGAPYEDLRCNTCSFIVATVQDRVAQPEQELVAYLCENAVGHKYFRWKKPSSTYKPIALYTSPPQRTWVGLTYEDMVKLQKDLYDAKGESVLPTTFAMAVEAKLRSKNT